MWRCALLLMAVIALEACAPAAPPAALAGPPSAAPAPDPSLAAELERLRASFAAEAGAARAPDPSAREARVARARAALEASAYRPSGPELLVAVDRNPEVQALAVLLARPEGPWEVVGESLVSTGARGRRGQYLTRTGVFLHTDAILDYRALGTRNALGVRGLGARGMRVWDFGWLTAEKGWREDGETALIRFLLHATDPDLLEPRLGRPASQGCVRIPSGVNRFLDLQGVLDADHERAARAGDARFAALLHPERTPSPFAGRALIVLDSGAPEDPPR
jgi:hypothetical protein